MLVLGRPSTDTERAEMVCACHLATLNILHLPVNGELHIIYDLLLWGHFAPRHLPVSSRQLGEMLEKQLANDQVMKLPRHSAEAWASTTA